MDYLSDGDFTPANLRPKISPQAPCCQRSLSRLRGPSPLERAGSLDLGTPGMVGSLLFASRHSGRRSGYPSLNEHQGRHHAECESVKTTRRLSPQSGIVSSRRPMSATLQPSRIRHQRSGAAFPRRGRSTKSAASSASLRSVLRGVPIRARMVRPRAKSVTWIARTATGKSGGMSPAQIPSRKRRSTSAAPPATALCRNR